MSDSPTKRTKVKRLPDRGAYDRKTINAILDEGLVCHVGFVVDGQPFVIPTGYARDGDRLIVHGSSASRMLRALREGIDVCVTVTLVDALVIARSAFHHSMNYRSVVILGRATLIDDPGERMVALARLTEHLVPGRWDDCRQPNEKEMKATMVLSIPLDEASAKIRTGPPSDDDEDYALSHWAGVVPLPFSPGPPEDDPKLTPGITPPDYISKYTRKKSSRKKS